MLFLPFFVFLHVNMEIMDNRTETAASAKTTAVPEVTSGSLELRSEDLVKVYGKRTVVNKVSFNVHQGEIVGLLGPNGCICATGLRWMI